MSINLSTFWTTWGVSSGDTSSTNQYDFWRGIIMDDNTQLSSQYDFFKYNNTTRYEFFNNLNSTYPEVWDEYTFYQNTNDPRIFDFDTFYQYAAESLPGGTPPPEPLLLDIYTGSSTAYSLRKLTNTYSGNSIRVRRSSDNTEQNIGFVNNYVDTTSLSGFCSGTDCFVTTWYDQSGNGNNLTQSGATSQPQIVSSGNVIIDNGKVILQFDGSNDVMINTTASAYKSVFTVFNPMTAISYEAWVGADDSHLFARDNVDSFLYNSFVSFYQNYDTGTYVNSAQTINFTNSIQQLFIVGDTTSRLETAKVTLGDDNAGSNFASAKITEFIAWTNFKGDDRVAISNNINTYYTLY